MPRATPHTASKAGTTESDPAWLGSVLGIDRPTQNGERNVPADPAGARAGLGVLGPAA
eukprot:CAMPEP_0204351574 /NCGR_PEP_ID=MMETSP0469-20131031/31236_1 /ASSEMBLY_ACC=CAM_ASM_000384 /TAXON_ID=2969 /ORGANISM="Oxyrrhis marina" /LENGTH=57 /DNA_ID=CAMNT_0051338157 /DNA_START=9 /DNA_END=178 /DNA_ORIENTATION=-